MKRQDLIKKYEAYQSLGHAVFTVTLSTYVTSPAFASSDRMRHFWDNHFMHRVRRALPVRAKLDHDWLLELSPGGNYHYHGFLVVESKYGEHIWRGGGLRNQLQRDLDSLRQRGKYRPFCMNAHLIEPARIVAAWSNYITKQQRTLLTHGVQVK